MIKKSHSIYSTHHGSAIFNPLDRLPKRIANATLMDSVLCDHAPLFHVTNNTDAPISFRESDYIGMIETDPHYNPNRQTTVRKFRRFSTRSPYSLKKGSRIFGRATIPRSATWSTTWSEARPRYRIAKTSWHTNSCPCWISIRDYPRHNKRYSNKSSNKHQKAFSLDGRIGEYSDIKYAIKLTEDTVPISMPPYHASPEKRADIDKQIDKWFSQGVIRESESPWGVPVIVVYWNGKARVCIDYQRVNAVMLADEYPLPRQTNILRALSGSQWLSTFNALSGFHQLEIVEEHRHINGFSNTQIRITGIHTITFRTSKRARHLSTGHEQSLSEIPMAIVLVYIDDMSYTLGHSISMLNTSILSLEWSQMPTSHCPHLSVILDISLWSF